jgi:ABC-type Zn uptake system ZnuABC Zn-binding protein ZnuA
MTVDLSEGIETLAVPTAELAAPSPNDARLGRTSRHQIPAKVDHAHAPQHEGADAHYWLDPVRMQQVVMRIEQQLAIFDPEHAQLYADRAQRVRAGLEKLHAEILERTQSLLNRRFIALHAAWTYFAPRYNLVQAAVVEPSPGREPSPRYLADLAQLMRREGVVAVVIEPQLTSTAAQALARETGARVGMLDPYGGPGVPGRQSYIDLMRYNVAELVKLLD